MPIENPLPTIPSFPPYPGPHRVGTAEYEIPISDLSSPAERSGGDDCPISTISFRVFYPAASKEEGEGEGLKRKKGKPVYWIPDPQREFVGAYARFLGVNWAVSRIASYVNFFDFISISFFLCLDICTR
jgi:platelet-activating factor acetylhydrolase